MSPDIKADWGKSASSIHCSFPPLKQLWM